MIIQCTHCKAKFRIPDSKAKKDEIKARCAKCEQIFVAHKGKNAFPENNKTGPEEAEKSGIDSITKNIEEELSASDVSASGEEEDFSFSDSDFGLDSEGNIQGSDDSIAITGNTQDQIEEQAKPAQGDTHQKLKEEVSEELIKAETMANTQALPESEMSEEDVNNKSVTYREVSENGKAVAKIQLKKIPIAGLSGKTRVQKKEWIPGKWIYLLYPLVVFIAAFSGFIAAGININFKNLELLQSKVSHTMSGDFLVTDISSENIQTVSGEDLYTISGWIFNNTAENVGKVVLEAELYSKERRFIMKEKFPCCVNLSKMSIHELSVSDSFEPLYTEDKVVNLESYKKLPFTLIFKKPEEAVESFRINIING